MEVAVTPYSAEILASSYHISGEVRPRGNPTIYFNDAQYPALTVYNATLKSIIPGARPVAMKAAEFYVPKNEVHILTLRDFDPHEAQLPPTIRHLICFTDTYILRGRFHTGPETRPVDVFYFGAGPFYGATEVEVFGVRPLAEEVNLYAPFAYIHRDALRAFYSENAEAE